MFSHPISRQAYTIAEAMSGHLKSKSFETIAESNEHPCSCRSYVFTLQKVEEMSGYTFTCSSQYFAVTGHFEM